MSGEKETADKTKQEIIDSLRGRHLRIALAGNPNCGKTTVFNGYTGARQHVGNYPGVTVDRKEGELNFRGIGITLVDLPGTYSLTAYSQEELVARKELSCRNVQSVIDVVDSSALERGLLLTVQLLEMGMQTVLACNMMDEAEGAGIKIDMPRLGQLLDVPVVPMVGKEGKGLDEAMTESVALAAKGCREPLRISYGPDLDTALMRLEKIMEKNGLLGMQYPPRWVAIKLLENDSEMMREAQDHDPQLARQLAEICQVTATHVRNTFNCGVESLITDHRYGYIRSLLRNGVFTQDASKDRLAFSDRLDRVLTNAIFGPLIMLLALYMMYQVTFEVGAYPQGWIEDGFAWLGEKITEFLPEGLVQSLMVDGIIAGVGGVISFVPLIMIMFALISFMEDSGYMARMAYMMDRVFRFFGLHGASVMPYVISGGIAGGCAIPGAMATRTLRSPKEKLTTLLTLPYMTCGAKLPLFLLLAGSFFPDNAATVMFCIMIAGWVFALLVARLLRSTIIKGEATPFVMELPPYRMPTLFSVLLHCWERAWMYMKKAGTVLLAISVLIWAALTFPELPGERSVPFNEKIALMETQLVDLEKESDAYKSVKADLDGLRYRLEEEKLAYSLAGRMGRWLEPVTRPVGFDWRTDIALLAGVAAKEAVVTTMGTAWALGEQDPDDPATLSDMLKADPSWSGATALSLMLFVLLYSPCFVALVVIRQEAGSWIWLAFSIVFNTALAYAVALVVFQTARLVL